MIVVDDRAASITLKSLGSGSFGVFSELTSLRSFRGQFGSFGEFLGQMSFRGH